MKHTLVMFATICCFAFSSRATVHTVSVNDRDFSPAKDLKVHAGDTIKWVWAAGAHNIVGTIVPRGAAAISGKVNGKNPSLIYVPTFEGSYDYQCKYYGAMGMTGNFTVVNGNVALAEGEGTSAGTGGKKGPSAFSAFPTPTSGNVHLQFHNPALPVVVTITDNNGNLVKRVDYPGVAEADLDLKAVPNGNYVIHADQGDRMYKVDLQVIH